VHSTVRRKGAGIRIPIGRCGQCYGRRPDLLAGQVWKDRDSTRQEFIVRPPRGPRGDSQGFVISAPPTATPSLTQSIDAMASAGLRVFGFVSHAQRYAGQEWPASRANLHSSSGTSACRVRAVTRHRGVREAARRYQAGVMITGDYSGDGQGDSTVKLASSMANSSAAKNLRRLMTRKGNGPTRKNDHRFARSAGTEAAVSTREGQWRDRGGCPAMAINRCARRS